MVEVVYLEKDLSICAASLDILNDFELDQIRLGHFPVAASAIRKVQELQAFLGRATPEKSALLEACLKKLTGPKTLKAVETHLAEKGQPEWPALLGFFELLGPGPFPPPPTSTNRWRRSRPGPRSSAFIREMAGADPSLIVSLADDARPALLDGDHRSSRAHAREQGGHPSVDLRDVQEPGHQARGHPPPRRHEERDGQPHPRGLPQRPRRGDPDPGGHEARSLRGRVPDRADPARGGRPRDSATKSLKEKEAILSFLGRTRSGQAFDFLCPTAREDIPVRLDEEPGDASGRRRRA